MKRLHVVRLLSAIVVTISLVNSDVRAEVTMDQVRDEVQRQLKSAETAKPAETPSTIDQSKIDFKSGNGIPIVESPNGTMRISGYMLVRYINQLPSTQSFQDHLGNTRNIDTSNYISAPHRVLLSFMGWVYDPRFLYSTTLWTVNATDKTAIIGYLAWVFSKKMTVFAGVGALPGTRTLTYNHPYWMGSDRNMADEFFRPGFTQGVWASGELLPGLNYTTMLGNNLTTLNVNAAEDSRDFAASANVWWMPTTHEFGPKGGMGDFENHTKLATRFGGAYTQGRQNRATSSLNQAPDSTQIRMADSLLPFDTGAIAPGVTVENVTYQLSAVDAGFKYRGFHLQTEGYMRRLSKFDANGAIPFNSVVDTGFYAQVSQMIKPKKYELYLATSFIFADEDAGYRDSHEYIQGINRYLFGTRNSRLNLHVIEVYRSAASSVFGYYVGGQKGTTVSASWSVNF